MIEDRSQHGFANCKRRGDRRACKHVSPPPYHTGDGLVTVDRRSHLDRRASWLREFSLDFSLAG